MEERDQRLQHVRVRQAIAIIDRRFADPAFSSKLLARALSCRPSRLNLAFHAETGQTPASYLRDRRLEEAARLLTTTNRRVKEIWSAVGYNHASNFDHDFKRRFSVSPRAFRTRCVLPAVPAPPIAAQFRHVLIVDDDVSSREFIGRYMQLSGCRVSTCASGSEAVARARELQPDAVLLDYHLPDIDGLECLRQLRSQLRQAVIVVFSADCDLELRAHEFARYDAQFLSKLCDLDDLSAALFDARGPAWATTGSR